MLILNNEVQRKASVGVLLENEDVFSRRPNSIGRTSKLFSLILLILTDGANPTKQALQRPVFSRDRVRGKMLSNPLPVVGSHMSLWSWHLNSLMRKDSLILFAVSRCSQFFQVELDLRSRDKSAFVTRLDWYESKVMPFVFCNAPSTFQRLYLDVLILFYTTFEEYLVRLGKVFWCL